MRALTWPFSTSSKHSLTSSSLPGLPDHPGAALSVDRVDLGEVLAGADDGPADRDAVQHRLEDRQLDEVVRRQRDEDQRAAAAQRVERLLERLRRDGHGDRRVRSAERLDGRDRVLGQRVDDVVGAELLGQLQLLVADVDRDTVAPLIFAYCRARWPSPPMPNTATSCRDGPRRA